MAAVDDPFSPRPSMPPEEEPIITHELDSQDDDWRNDAKEIADRARAWVEDNPFAAVGIAVATGFIVGRIVRR